MARSITRMRQPERWDWPKTAAGREARLSEIAPALWGSHRADPVGADAETYARLAYHEVRFCQVTGCPTKQEGRSFRTGPLIMSGRWDLNPRPLDPQSSTLNQAAPRPGAKKHCTASAAPTPEPTWAPAAPRATRKWHGHPARASRGHLGPVSTAKMAAGLMGETPMPLSCCRPMHRQPGSGAPAKKASKIRHHPLDGVGSEWYKVVVKTYPGLGWGQVESGRAHGGQF